MTYIVTISLKSGQETYLCGGATDQEAMIEAMIYAGKVVEKNVGTAEPDAAVVISKDGKHIGPPTTVAELKTRAV